MPSEHFFAWQGRLTDGRTARALDVTVALGHDGLELHRRPSDAVAAAATGAPASWPYAELASSVPLSNNATDVLLTTKATPGATLFVDDPAFASALAQRAPQLGLRAQRMSGLKPGSAVGAIAFALTAAVYALDLSPSKGLARLMPETARAALGQSVLQSLPPGARSVCAAPEGRRALSALASRLLPDDPAAAHRINVVAWDVLNAFAVPGGQVILTKRILTEARSPDELAGVIAHELGHGLELHPEAGLVRSVGFWALVQMMFTGAPGAIGNAGTLLAQLAHTRTAEREADDRALAMLRRAGISPKPFSDFFRRMDRPPNETDKRSDGRSAGRGVTSIFSTHPATPERIAKIEGQPVYPATPALDDALWRALKSICDAPR